jgi:hypothetical protein
MVKNENDQESEKSQNQGIAAENLLEKYRENITEEDDIEKLKQELPEPTFQRIENLIDNHDSLSEVITTTGLQEISKVELKFLVSLYSKEPADFVLNAKSLREQYEIILETLYNEVGEVEI